MQRHHHIGPRRPRQADPGFQRHEDIVFARQVRVHPGGTQHARQFMRKDQHQRRLVCALRLGPRVDPAMPRIQHDDQRAGAVLSPFRVRHDRGARQVPVCIRRHPGKGRELRITDRAQRDLHPARCAVDPGLVNGIGSGKFGHQT